MVSFNHHREIYCFGFPTFLFSLSLLLSIRPLSISNNKKRKCSVVFKKKKKLFSLIFIFGERSCGVPINSSKNADSFLTLRELRLSYTRFRVNTCSELQVWSSFPAKIFLNLISSIFSSELYIIIYHLWLWQWRDFTMRQLLYTVNELRKCFLIIFEIDFFFDELYMTHVISIDYVWTTSHHLPT